MGSDDRPADAEPQTPSSPLAQSLSVRESPILKLTAEGLSNKEIARTLAVTPETVKSHGKHIFINLNVEKRAQAVARADARFDGQSSCLVSLCRYVGPENP
jgi:ATP/maltotriose-dependent transcriptional regulator MalT